MSIISKLLDCIYSREIQIISNTSEREFRTLGVKALAKLGFSETENITSPYISLFVVETDNKGLCLKYHQGHAVMIDSNQEGVMSLVNLKLLCERNSLKLKSERENVCETFLITMNSLDKEARELADLNRIKIVGKYSLSRTMSNTHTMNNGIAA